MIETDKDSPRTAPISQLEFGNYDSGPKPQRPTRPGLTDKKA